MMTKQTYQSVADDIRHTWQRMYDAQNGHSGLALIDECFSELIENMVVSFRMDNPRFDADKFRQACTK